MVSSFVTPSPNAVDPPNTKTLYSEERGGHGAWFLPTRKPGAEIDR
jgi:hypothetical protein